jgi:Smg protein
MKNDVLDVLMYIFEQFQDQEYVVIDEANKLATELTEVGFSDVEIDSALDWIDGLVDLREQAQTATGEPVTPSFSNRIFSDQECQVLSQRSRGFLYHLEQQGVLDPTSREIVIERTLALNMLEVDIEQVKWITMMVLFNLPGRESACAWFENSDHQIH